MLNKKALAATAGAQKLYVEDIFSCFLYTGNGSTQTITNGIDLSGEGGMVWVKSRNATWNNQIGDTVRGAGKTLLTNSTSEELVNSAYWAAFNSNGFGVSSDGNWNYSNDTYASWTFRKAEKFFDVVTYTGNGTTQNIAHSLGSTPGCIIVKSTNNTFSWGVYHRSYPNGYLFLNSANAGDTANAQNMWGNNSTVVAPTSTQFTVGSFGTVNSSGTTYVAYLFAHNAGGFGENDDQNVISCGSFTTDSNSRATITLGYEPQWIMFKSTQPGDNWEIDDVMRGWSETQRNFLSANTSFAEGSSNQVLYPIKPTSTGFLYDLSAVGGSTFANKTYIYIAIRRGPMKTPEAGTEVFEPFVDRTSIANKTNGTMGPVDMTMQTQVSSPFAGYHWTTFDRLRGANKYILTASTAAEATDTSVSFDVMGGVKNATWFSSGGVGYNFKRAPKFFDIVCYTGTGSARTVTHNLGVAPEMYITKRRNSNVEGDWGVYHASVGNTKALFLNATAASSTSNLYWNNTSPTSTNFSVGTWAGVNDSGSTYVAYLFATLAGVSKVGSYTGNGSSQTINCGFTGGARFVLLKATSTTGDWVVFDSARGIVSGSDPYLLLNSTAAEVTNKDAVDTDSTGFIVNETSGPNINTNGVSYIYLAIS